MSSRRIASVFLPDLPCELGGDVAASTPLAVVITASSNLFPTDRASRLGQDPTENLPLGETISSVNEAARRAGVQVGQTVADARAKVSSLAVRSVTTSELVEALGRVAEVMLAFAPTVSIRSSDVEAPLDTAWVDLTSSAHLFGGEEAIVAELSSRVRALGHRVRVALADGPRLAKCVATFGPSAETVVAPSGGEEALRDFPIASLPLSRERVVWLNRLGLWSVSDLTKLPSSVLSSRLGEHWQETLDLVRGRDDAPLIPYEPPPTPSERGTWDEPVTSIEPLLFSLRGLVSRLAARLEGRGLAVQTITLDGPYDRSIARLRLLKSEGLFFRIELPTPIAHKNDLFRVLKSKLENSVLEAPVTGLTVTAASLAEAPKMQLCLGRDAAIDTDPRAMAILLAELSAEIGPENVGVLELARVHRPEARTQLVPVPAQHTTRSQSRSVGKNADTSDASDVEFPTRLLRVPVPLQKMPGPGHGSTVAIDNRIFQIESVRHSMRFDQVEWWTSSPLCRDYARVWLTSGARRVEAWVFTDRLSGRSFLHGYFD